MLLHNLVTCGYWDQWIQRAASHILESAQTSRELQLIIGCTNTNGQLNKNVVKRQQEINRNTIVIGKYLYGSKWSIFDAKYKYIEENSKKKAAVKSRQVSIGKVIAKGELESKRFTPPMNDQYS